MNDINSRLKKGKITYQEAHNEVSKIKKTTKESDLSNADIEMINQMTSDFMPDYNFHPPMSIDAAGRWFITPFATFTTRAQRIILGLMERNPMTMFGGFLLAESMGMEFGQTPYHIVGSNFITRDQYINDVFTSLFDPMTIFPTNVFNFDIVR
jgi:hypothetical protein